MFSHVSHREAGRTAPIHIRPRSGPDKFGAPPHSRSRFSWWYIQWRSQGGHGGHDPHPKLLVNVFFWRLPMHFRLTTLKIGPPNVTWPIFVEIFSAQGSTHYSTDCWSADTEKILPLPPHQIGGDGKFLLLPPPIWSAAGDHGKGGPPKKKSWLCRWIYHDDQAHVRQSYFESHLPGPIMWNIFLSTPRMLARTNTSQNNLKNM